MIPVNCHTNLDEFVNANWPKQFCCRPKVGDYVKASNGKRLKIVSITHIVGDSFGVNEPMLSIELYK